MRIEMRCLSDVGDYLGFLVLAAPDRFPKIGPFGDDSAENLTIAFEDLRGGLPVIEQVVGDAVQMVRIRQSIDRAYTSYLKGDVIDGAQSLQAIENVLFPEQFGRYKKRTKAA